MLSFSDEGESAFHEHCSETVKSKFCSQKITHGGMLKRKKLTKCNLLRMPQIKSHKNITDTASDVGQNEKARVRIFGRGVRSKSMPQCFSQTIIFINLQ